MLHSEVKAGFVLVDMWTTQVRSPQAHKPSLHKGRYRPPRAHSPSNSSSVTSHSAGTGRGGWPSTASGRA